MIKEVVAKWTNKENPNEFSTVYLCSEQEVKKILETPSEQKLITSVHIYPVNNKKQVMLTKNPRGWDIIGGHVEKVDGGNFVNTAKRETFEEGGLEIEDFEPLAVMMVDNKFNPSAMKKYPVIGYQIFGVSKNFKQLNIPQGSECTQSQWFDIDDMKKIHHNWVSAYNEMINKVLAY